jgi:hypothetical protein
MLLALVLVVSMATFTACSGEETSTPTPTPSPTTPAPTPPGAELPPSAYLPEVPRIGIEEVKAKLDAGANLIIVDSRFETSHEKSHIVGAISLPITAMAEPYSDLEGYDEIITYCD